MRRVRKATGAIAEELRQQVSARCRIAVGSFERKLFSRDVATVPAWLRRLLHRTTPLLVAQPQDEADLVKVVRFAAERHIPLFPRGISSSAFGGAVPTHEGIVIDCSGMAEILDVDSHARTCRVQAGVRWADLAQTLAPHDLLPLTTPSSRFSTVGGWASTGGLGIESLRYGHFRRAVIGARVVLPDGSVLSLQAGDERLEDLIGTEGQFGILSEFTLRLRPHASYSSPILFYFDGVQPAIEFMERILTPGEGPSHIVFMDRARMAEENHLLRDRLVSPQPLLQEREAVLLHFDDPADEERLLSSPACAEGCLAPSPHARFLWSGRYFPLKAQRLGPKLLASEVVLPLRRLPAYVSRARRLARCFGSTLSIEATPHQADGVQECVVIAAFTCDAKQSFDYLFRLLLVQILTDLGIALGGRPYGIGIWNTPLLSARFSRERRLTLLRRKQQSDPDHLLNPGKFFRMQTRFANLPGVLFVPWAYAISIRLARTLALILGLPARVLTRANRQRSWPVPSPTEEGGRRLLREVAERCTFCGSCVPTCLAWVLTRDERTTGRGKLQLVEALASGEPVSPSEAHAVFQCFVCGLCEEVCQVRLPLRDAYTVLEAWISERHGRPDELIREFAASAEADRDRLTAAFGLELPPGSVRGRAAKAATPERVAS